MNLKHKPGRRVDGKGGASVTGPERISHLYQMAVEAHQGTAVWSLRHAALAEICAETAKQPGVVDWLRDRSCLAMEPFWLWAPLGAEAQQWWMVLVRDETISVGASRGTPAPTVEESAATALVWHLAMNRGSPMKRLFWIIFDEDGDFAGAVTAVDETAAVAAARALGCEGHFTVRECSAAEIRNARRRERYAEIRDNGPGHTSRARPAPEGFVFELSWSASMAIYDEKGRCRCPTCARFSVPADFAKAPTSAVLQRADGAGRICVDFGPACWRCRGLERAPYDAA